MAKNEIQCVVKIDSASVFQDIEKIGESYKLPKLTSKYQFAAMDANDMIYAFEDEQLNHGSLAIACSVGGVVLAGDKLVNHFKLIAGISE